MGMTVIDENEIRNAIKTVPKETLSSQLKPHLQLIDEQMRAGIKLKAIAKELNERGLEVKESTLRTYLTRWRRTQKQPVSPENKPAPITTAQVSPAQKITNKGDLKRNRETFDQRYDVTELEKEGQQIDWGDS